MAFTIQEEVQPTGTEQKGSVSEINWDDFYDEELIQDEVDMKSHGSVITHLLSQVNIYYLQKFKTKISDNVKVRLELMKKYFV